MPANVKTLTTYINKCQKRLETYEDAILEGKVPQENQQFFKDQVSYYQGEIIRTWDCINAADETAPATDDTPAGASLPQGQQPGASAEIC